MRAAFTTYGLGGSDPAKPNGNVVATATIVTAGLGSDTATLTVGAAAVLHYAGTEPSAAWTVNGITQTVPTALVSVTEGGDGVLRESAVTVTAAATGPLVVFCNGHTLTLTVL